MIIYKVVYSRCIEDKIGQFLDLCSISNISMFIFTHAKYGYYLHGKSPNGNAEVTMKEMIAGFEREEFGIVPKRGLEPDNNNQIFSVSMTNQLRKKYTNLMMPIYEVSINLKFF